jgi:hypothetical protein
MTDASSVRILYPLFGMFALTMFVLLRMRSMRFAAVRSGAVPQDYYRAYPEGVEPEPLRIVARHYANLFEMPVLFYAGVILVYVTQQVSGWMVGLAWAYLALRCAHSFVHLTSNHLIARFSLYFGSAFVLALLWGTLLVRLVRA